MNDIFDNDKSIETIVNEINAVTVADVVQTAKLLKLQAIYFLNGEIK